MFLDPRRDDNEDREGEANLYDSLLRLLTAWLDEPEANTLPGFCKEIRLPEAHTWLKNLHEVAESASVSISDHWHSPVLF